MSDIDTVLVDSLKALDPKRPIREADVKALPIRHRKICGCNARFHRGRHDPAGRSIDQEVARSWAQGPDALPAMNTLAENGQKGFVR